MDEDNEIEIIYDEEDNAERIVARQTGRDGISPIVLNESFPPPITEVNEISTFEVHVISITLCMCSY